MLMCEYVHNSSNNYETVCLLSFSYGVWDKQWLVLSHRKRNGNINRATTGVVVLSSI